MEHFEILEDRKKTLEAINKILGQIPLMVSSSGMSQLGDSYSDPNKIFQFFYATCYSKQTFETSYMKWSMNSAERIRVTKWLKKDISVLDLDYQSTLASKIAAFLFDTSMEKNRIEKFWPQKTYQHSNNVTLKIDGIQKNIDNFHLKMLFSNDGNIAISYHDITAYPCSKLEGLDELFGENIIYLVDDVPVDVLPNSIASIQAYSTLVGKSKFKAKHRLNSSKCIGIPFVYNDLGKDYLVSLSHKTENLNLDNMMFALEVCRGKLYKLNMLKDETLLSLGNKIGHIRALDPFEFLLNPLLTTEERYRTISFQTYEVPNITINLHKRFDYNSVEIPEYSFPNVAEKMETLGTFHPSGYVDWLNDFNFPSTSGYQPANNVTTSIVPPTYDSDWEDEIDDDDLVDKNATTTIDDQTLISAMLNEGNPESITNFSDIPEIYQEAQTCEGCLGCPTNSGDLISTIYSLLDMVESVMSNMDVPNDLLKKYHLIQEKKRIFMENLNLVAKPNTYNTHTYSHPIMNEVALPAKLCNDTPCWVLSHQKE